MCVATALLISIFFQLLHSCYYPYNRDGLNRLQQLALTVNRLLVISPIDIRAVS
jgi:hypothetical protein